MGASRVRAPTLDSIATALLAFVDEGIQADLRTEDPATAVELYFAPIGCQPLPRANIVTGSCSFDGYYIPDVGTQPWIFYAANTHPDRARFTVAHELAHHLLATVAAGLLDDIDVVGAQTGAGAIQTEEAVCHRFAGRLLVPDELVFATIGDLRVVPEHVVAIHEAGGASWEAVAVRVAEAMPAAGAVVLLREAGTVAFCAASPRLGSAWWPRGSRVDPNGPLACGLHLRQIAQPEQYRYGLGYARAMFCDTLPVHDRLAIGVLTDKPSDGGLSIIEQPEPAWKERIEFCEWHPGVERDVGWCDKCKGRRCPECWRCGCTHPVKSYLCPGCGLLKPFRAGAPMCWDCEADQA